MLLSYCYYDCSIWPSGPLSSPSDDRVGCAAGHHGGSQPRHAAQRRVPVLCARALGLCGAPRRGRGVPLEGAPVARHGACIILFRTSLI